jgi:CBS domain-containing protein
MSAQDLPNELCVKAWMNSPDHTIGPDAAADEAFDIMISARVRHLLVVKDDELVGVVTDRDLPRTDTEGVKVSDVMSDGVVTAAPNDSTAQAARVMVENKFNCLPVVNEDKVVGILTSSDLLAALVYQSDPAFADVPE